MNLMTDVNFCGVASLGRMVSFVKSVEELVDYDSVNNHCRTPRLIGNMRIVGRILLQHGQTVA